MKFIDKSGREPNYLLIHRKSDRKYNYDTFCNQVGLGPVDGDRTKLKPTLNGILRKDLLDQQGHLCAFCMREIPEYPYKDNDMKVAHWYPQAGELTKSQQLDITYKNMFAACCGGMTRPAKKMTQADETCDTKQSSKHLVINPSLIKHIQLLHYQDDGEIYCIKIAKEDLKIQYQNLQIHKGKDDTHISKTGIETVEKRLDEIDLSEDELKLAIQYDIEFNLNLNEKTLKSARASNWRSVSDYISRKFRTPFKGKCFDRKQKNDFLMHEINKKLGFKSFNKFYAFCMVDVYYLNSRRK